MSGLFDDLPREVKPGAKMPRRLNGRIARMERREDAAAAAHLAEKPKPQADKSGRWGEVPNQDQPCDWPATALGHRCDAGGGRADSTIDNGRTWHCSRHTRRGFMPDDRAGLQRGIERE